MRGKLNLPDIAAEHPDLTVDEQTMLLQIRQHKAELRREIDDLNARLAEVNSDIYAMDSLEGLKQKHLQMGRNRFNIDAKKGIQFLLTHGLIDESANDVAHFLFTDDALSKTMIGDYLGEKLDFNESVLAAFVELHDFSNMSLVQSLRQFLWSFRLPGEAQKIDRMMEAFAKRYTRQHPTVFSSSDTCYVLAFSIIMLNTSLHNPNVKSKPTIDQFVTMNRSIDDGRDIDRDTLVDIYDSIRAEPFRIPHESDEATGGGMQNHILLNADRQGWLWKQGIRYAKAWKRRWFVLSDNCLYYFEYTTDKEPRGIIPLQDVQVRDASVTPEAAAAANATPASGGGGAGSGQQIAGSKEYHCFEIFSTLADDDGSTAVIKSCKSDSEGKLVEGKHTVYRISAATEEEKDEWIKALQRSINRDPFHEMLLARQIQIMATSRANARKESQSEGDADESDTSKKSESG